MTAVQDLQRVAQDAQRRFASAAPEELLAWAAATFAPRVALSCSFGGPGGIVLAHMVHRLDLPIPLVFIDTGFLFPETYKLKEHVEKTLSVACITVAPALSPDEQAARYGDRLWERDPDQCCHLRKVEPMARILETVDCWITALRRDQSPTRAHIEPVELHRLNGGRAILKLNPLAHWTRQEVWKYVSEHGLPYNPLLDDGYKSIGCVQCTARATGDERSGRWKGHDKTECGLHTFTRELSGRGTRETVE